MKKQTLQEEIDARIREAKEEEEYREFIENEKREERIMNAMLYFVLGVIIGFVIGVNL